jgi:hypothetical protein
MYVIQHCFICRPSDPLCRRMLNPGLLRHRHWQPDALTTRLDLIHTRQDLVVVGCWIPMVHVGPLRNFLVPVVVPPLLGTPSPSCSGGLHQVSLCFRYAFLKPCTVPALFISLGIKFHASTTLFEKKFLLVSSLEACCFRFSGSEALLVVLTVTSTLWNHVLLATLSCPCISSTLGKISSTLG